MKTEQHLMTMMIHMTPCIRRRETSFKLLQSDGQGVRTSDGTTKGAIDKLKDSSKVTQTTREALDPRKQVNVSDYETDVTYAGGMYQKLKDLEAKHGVTGEG
ncbi:hypothetical protein MAL04_20270 (plasmid) [Leptospira noguchii]|nr:hypothetical protein MAL04_20270 [Leptospira noguchii]